MSALDLNELARKANAEISDITEAINEVVAEAQPKLTQLYSDLVDWQHFTRGLEESSAYDVTMDYLTRRIDGVRDDICMALQRHVIEMKRARRL